MGRDNARNTRRKEKQKRTEKCFQPSNRHLNCYCPFSLPKDISEPSVAERQPARAFALRTVVELEKNIKIAVRTVVKREKI